MKINGYLKLFSKLTIIIDNAFLNNKINYSEIHKKNKTTTTTTKSL